METCEVTFDETQPCNSSVFECAGDHEVGNKIFEDEEDDAGEDDGDDGEAPATRVPYLQYDDYGAGWSIHYSAYDSARSSGSNC
jgi:hypothetical protein